MDKLTTRSMPLRPSTFDEKTSSIRAVIATEDPTQVWDWEQMDVLTEVLLLSGMTLPEGREQVPLLDCHMRYSVENQLGSVRDFAPEGDVLLGTVFFDSTEKSQQARTKVTEGHLTDLSVGYIILERYYVSDGATAVINGREFKGPVKVCTKWVLKETSVTPMGAGNRATFRSAPDDHEMDEKITQRINAVLSAREQHNTNKGGTTMPDTPEKTAASAEEVRQAAQKAVDDDRARQAEINAMAERHGTMNPEIPKLAREACAGNTTPAEFWKRIEPLMKKAGDVDTGSRDDEPVVKIHDVTPAWQRRSVALLQVMTTRAMGSNRLSDAQKRYAELLQSASPRAMEEELRQAVEIVKAAKLPRMQEERALSIVGGGSTGEYLLPAPFLAELFVIIEQYGAARRYFRPVVMTSATLDLSTVSTKPTAVWATEGSNSTAYDPAFGTGQLAAGKLVGITSWTSELEEDSAIALLPTLLMLMAEAIFTKEDAAGFKGDGTGTYGSFTGILNAATAAVTMDAGNTAFTNCNADNLRAVRDALTLAKRAGAMWFLHPDILSHVEGLKDANLNYIYRAPGADRPALLWGYPIANNEGIESMPSVADSAAATRFVAFGNPKWMLMGIRRGLEVLVSREGILNTAADAISFNALQADGAILRVSERIAFKAPLGAAFAYLKTAAA